MQNMTLAGRGVGRSKGRAGPKFPKRALNFKKGTYFCLKRAFWVLERHSHCRKGHVWSSERHIMAYRDVEKGTMVVEEGT